MSIQIIKSGDLKNIVETITKKTKILKVGFFDEVNASKAYWNEYGNQHAGKKLNIKIPARPFMQQTYDKYKNSWMKLFKNLLAKNKNLNKSVALLGERAVDDMKKTINKGNFVPNATATINKKGKDTPLIDIGDMLNAVTYTTEK